MNLQIRDPRARELARRLATARKVTMSEAVVGALEAEVERLDERPLAERLAPVIAEIERLSKPGGHRMTKDEIDEMWWG